MISDTFLIGIIVFSNIFIFLLMKRVFNILDKREN
jgi:hypothetical protein